MRDTRQSRYHQKVSDAKSIPVHVATVNFQYEENVAFIGRAMACFGASNLHIIGAPPSSTDFTRLSGGLNKWLNVFTYKTPQELIAKARADGMFLVSAELNEDAVPLSKLKLPDGVLIMLVLGHESLGVPVEILRASNAITYIPMPGVGYCLNTSQAGNIILYELAKRFRVIE